MQAKVAEETFSEISELSGTYGYNHGAEFSTDLSATIVTLKDGTEKVLQVPVEAMRWFVEQDRDHVDLTPIGQINLAMGFILERDASFKGGSIDTAPFGAYFNGFIPEAQPDEHMRAVWGQGSVLGPEIASAAEILDVVDPAWENRRQIPPATWQALFIKPGDDGQHFNM